MTDQEMEQLKEELRHFEAEKEKIRQLVGQIGGASDVKREKVVTGLFVVVLMLLFVLDVCRHFIGMNLPFPPLFSLEIGVMLVSVKIIWMVHNQTRVEHFQFWILNSIEFRVNDIAKAVRRIQEHLREETAEREGSPDGVAS